MNRDDAYATMVGAMDELIDHLEHSWIWRWAYSNEIRALNRKITKCKTIIENFDELARLTALETP